ncbi:unnamed protein product [Leptosia nina]|uniref:Uncharacterized protein n=1 Tax=Leptosia nina TaxID=320188 RepID=A0AAV1JTM1_9NEOP
MIAAPCDTIASPAGGAPPSEFRPYRTLKPVSRRASNSGLRGHCRGERGPMGRSRGRARRAIGGARSPSREPHRAPSSKT